MPQSLSRILVHLIFSTKNRQPLIAPDVQGRLHGYIPGILHNLGCVPIQTGGTADHAHVLFALARTVTVSKVVEETKTGSSKWMKTQGVASFAWQTGYGAFSIGESQLETVVRYIQRQNEHHRRRSFQEELRLLLEKYNVPYDEKYVWD
ncbi:MAG: IS200/IS605 family transposase [Deltaproteobacteria bacterium]|nr:IS200/IS605 family transposase [Deltaproteobacteria bacterium]